MKERDNQTLKAADTALVPGLVEQGSDAVSDSPEELGVTENSATTGDGTEATSFPPVSSTN